MLYLRAIAINVLFYIITVGVVIAAIPTAVMPKKYLYTVARTWGVLILWMVRHVGGIKSEFRGLENLPDTKQFQNTPIVIAPKHQSTWDLFGLLHLIHQPVFAFKSELSWLPVFGQLLIKAQLIRLVRGKGRTTLDSLREGAGECFKRGDIMVVFPEGTRRSIDDPPAYKYGLTHLYENYPITVIPVALNAGLLWPRREFVKYPGTIIAEVLPAIPPGLSTEEFERRLQTALNDNSTRLIEERRALGEGIKPKK